MQRMAEKPPYVPPGWVRMVSIDKNYKKRIVYMTDDKPRITIQSKAQLKALRKYIILEGMASPTPPSWRKTTFSAEDDIFGGRRHFRRKTTFSADFFLQILDRLLSPTNFPHKHHGAISSRYAQIRASEFGGVGGAVAQLVF